MAAEDDAEHVVDLPFHPLRAGPDACHAVDEQAGVTLLVNVFVPVFALAGFGAALGIEKHLEPQPAVVPNAGQAVVDGEAAGRPAGIVEVINAIDFSAVVVPQVRFIAQEHADGLNVLAGNHDGDHVPKLTRLEADVGEALLQPRQRRVIDRAAGLRGSGGVGADGGDCFGGCHA